MKNNILDKSPAFPDSFLYNNVILRSLNQLQQKKQPEAEIKKIEEEKETQKIEGQPPSLTIPKTNQQPSPIPGALLEIETEGHHEQKIKSIKDHPFYKGHEKKFAELNSFDTTNVQELAIPFINTRRWKTMISVFSKEGVIYEDDSITVKCKTEYLTYFGRMLVSFISKNGPIDKINTEVKIPNGLEVQCSKIKYPAEGSADSPLMMIQLMITAPFNSSPTLSLTFQNRIGTRKVEFALPVLSTHFIEAKEVNAEEALELWEKLTESNADSSEKIDVILPNPVPNELTYMDVLLKLAEILQNYFGLHVIPPADENNFSALFAAGELQLKPNEQEGFPASKDKMGNANTVPVIMQVEFYPEVSVNEFTLSIRASTTSSIARPLLELFKLFINPAY